MRSKTDVTREIRAMVQDRIAAGVIVRVDWFTQEILSLKSRIEGDDADFYIACGADFIRDAVKRCIGDYAPKAMTVPQLIMDGFEHLQKAYTVNRDGENVLVPVDLLTDEEVEGRAAELEDMARGCIAHARELRGYMRHRAAAA
jgi:hypothetical protein